MNCSNVFGCLLLSAASAVGAAEIDLTYTLLRADQWTAAFTVVNDGAPAQISEFTVFFPDSLFSNLTFGGTPATWDSLVVTGDSAIPAPGFIDGLIRDPASPLIAGQKIDGFLVNFTYLGTDQPSALSFDIVGPDFKPVFSGTTTVTSAVPESTTSWFLSMGLLVIGVCQYGRQSVKNARTPS